MKNLKKTLSIVLALALVFSMGISSLAFDDVKDGTKVSEAVGILSNLGIIEGFEDGSFRPDDTVTRAQMAAIICRTLGYEDQAKGSEGTTVFVDVPANHWASGYINVAQSLGIINGYGYGYYGPEDKVTYEQAVKMLVVALGYELDAQAKGGWSTGYMAVASREGITKNSGGSVGESAKRGTIAVLTYNSLEVRLMDQQTWSTDGNSEYGKTDETILSQYLEVQKWEGVVSSVPYFDYAQNGYEEDADALMTLEDAYYTEYNNGRAEKVYEYLGSVDCSLVPDVNTLAGKKVVAYVGIDEDDRTGNRMVYAISEKQGANKSTVISAAQLVEDGDRYYNESDVIGYRNVGSTRINTLDLDDEVEVIVNYGAGEGATVNKTSDLEEIFDGVGGTIELISNDSNSKIDYIIATVYDEEAVIEEIDIQDEMITFNTYTGDIEEIDTEDEDTLVVVIRDGKVASVEDIEENDTVSVVGSEDFAEGFRILCVSSRVITGRVESYYDDVVVINDKEYDISPFMGAAASDLSGDEGLFFINVDRQIAWSEADSTTRGNYGLVIAAGTTSGINSGYEVEVVLADGTVAQYPLNSKAYVEEVDGTRGEKDDAATYNAIKVGMTSDGSAYRVKAEELESHVFEISVKNGKISKLKRVARGSRASNKDYDEENMAYGSICFDEATVVFSVEVSGSAHVESEDVAVGTVTDFFVDGEGDNCSLVAFDENSRDIAGLVIGFGLASTVPQDGDAFIITSVKYSEYNDYDAYVVTGFQGGKKVSYTICDEDEGYTGDERDLKKGNVILLGVENSNGIISDFESLYSVEDGVLASDNVSDEIYYIAGNLDEDRAPTDNKFYLMDNSNLQGSYYNNDNGIAMKSSANYTLVDYTESATNPEVSRKSKSKSIFGSLNKYDSVVFVRYYDDSLVEVVVYRYKDGYIDVPEVNVAIDVARPVATPGEGEVAENTVITLAAEPEATIYYTVDGTNPDPETATQYVGGITITETVTIKAVAVIGEYASNVATFAYTVEAVSSNQLQSPSVAEEPKAEEPKVEEPKVEEPKVEEPKAEEPKAEEPKAEEPKAEEPKAEEPKAEEPKAEEPKAEEPKAEEPKTEIKVPEKSLTIDKNSVKKIDLSKLEIKEKLTIDKKKFEKSPVEIAPVAKTDLNKATYAELTKLEGVTDAIATKIIEYRAKAPFKTVEELKNVQGVTEEIFNKIKANLTV